MTRAHIEYAIATAIAAALLAFLIPAILHARAEIRDNLRRSDIANLKHALEMYNNQHVFYLTSPDAKLGCTESTDKANWFFGDASPLLKEQHIDAIPHDVRESRGHVYTYCITDIASNATTGFYLEAELEVKQPDIVAHDFDESRNFGYRVWNENGRVLYRVCGGTEAQCTPPS